MIDITNQMNLFREGLIQNFLILQKLEFLNGNECPNLEYVNADSWDEISEALFTSIISIPLERSFGTYAVYGKVDNEPIQMEVLKLNNILIGTTRNDGIQQWLEHEGPLKSTYRFVEFRHPYEDLDTPDMKYVIGLSDKDEQISIPVTNVKFKIKNNI